MWVKVVKGWGTRAILGLRGLLVWKLGLNCGVEGVRDLETRAELWVQGLCNWQLGLNYAVEGVTVWLGLSRGCRRG